VSQLWLLRHGEAEPHGVRADADRALTDRGRAQSLAAGRALARLGVEFAAIYTSPRTRALDTATLAAQALGGRPQVYEPLHAGFSRADVEELFAAAPSGKLLLVGHEPDFSQVVYDLTGARIELKKGGIAVVRFPQGDLLRLLRPGEIELLAGVG
jgi:phosphohistidine phosphatase